LKVSIEHEISDQDSKPATDIERKIAELWCDILAIRNPVRGVSFFKLGGNSLTAAQLSSRLKQTSNVCLDLRDLFNFSTIADLADFVEKNQEVDNMHKSEITSDIQEDDLNSRSARELLGSLDQMDDAEVAELLKTMQKEGDSN
jgi:acyl carrier protein